MCYRDDVSALAGRLDSDHGSVSRFLRSFYEAVERDFPAGVIADIGRVNIPWLSWTDKKGRLVDRVRIVPLLYKVGILVPLLGAEVGGFSYVRYWLSICSQENLRILGSRFCGKPSSTREQVAAAINAAMPFMEGAKLIKE